MLPHPILIDIDSTNVDSAPCCGINDPAHPGLLEKRRWLKAHLKLGLRAKILVDDDGKPCGYIEYLPGESAWRRVDASGYMFIHCIWNHSRRNRGKGWASAMVKACVSDAKVAGMSGVAVMTRKGPWLAGSALFAANGFRRVDIATPD
ncbi:MAG: N-acetyltransferase family protein [Terriglobales bacterium]